MPSYKDFTSPQHIDENYWNDYYKDWGFIKPTGKVERMPSNKIVSDGHEELADKLGYDSVENALKQGLCRYLITRKNGQASFQLRDDPRLRKVVAQFIESNAGVVGKVGIEMYDRGFNRMVWSKEFDDAHRAALQVRNSTVNEATMYSTQARQWGFVTPEGKVVEGQKPDSHSTLALKLRFKSEHDAISHGLVRFVIDATGDVNLDMLNKTVQRTVAVKFLRNAATSNDHQVFVNFVAPDGNIGGYKDYETLKKAIQNLKDVPDGLVGLEEEIPVAHQGVPIAAYSREWGFIKPNGQITKGGDDPNGHLSLSSKMGFQSETDAITKGYIRYVIDPEGNVSLELTPERDVKQRAVRWLKLTPGLTGAIYVDTVGEHVVSGTYPNSAAAVAGILKLKEPKDTLTESNIVKSGFITPNGEVITADRKLADKAGFKGDGYIKFAILSDGSIDISLVKSTTTIANAVKFLKTVENNGVTMVTFVDDKGREVGFKSFMTAREAATKLPALKEDFFSVYRKPDKPLEPFDGDDEHGAPDNSGDVPGEDGAPLGAIADPHGEDQEMGVPNGPPFIAAT